MQKLKREKISHEHQRRLVTAIRRELHRSTTKEVYDARLNRLFDRALNRTDTVALAVVVREFLHDPI